MTNITKKSYKRVILSTFAGVPRTLGYFFPDAGLATLAGALNQKVNIIKIYDFNNLATIQECVDHNLSMANAESFLDLDRNSQNLKKDRNILIQSFIENAEAYLFRVLRQAVSVNKIDLICFKPWLGDSIRVIVAITRRLRQLYPSLKIAIGGPSISCIGDGILAFLKDFDFVTIGPGEQAINDIIDFLDNKMAADAIANTYTADKLGWIRGKMKTDASNFLTTPTYEPQIYLNISEGKLPVILVEESRGCVFQCAFCAHPLIGQKKHLGFDVHRTFSLIKSLVDDYGFSMFRFTGSCPTPSFFNQISEFINVSKMTLHLSAFFHTSFLKSVDFKKLAKAGFKALFTGVENFDPNDIENFFEKRITITQIDHLLYQTARYNIHLTQSYIYPSPNSNVDDFQLKISQQTRFKENTSIVISFPRIYPDTRWWNHPTDFGITFANQDEYLKWLIFGIKTAPDSNQIHIGNKHFNDLMQEYQLLKLNLIEQDFQVGITDEIALLSAFSGVNIKRFNYYQQLALQTLSAERIFALFERINFGAKRTGKTQNVQVV